MSGRSVLVALVRLVILVLVCTPLLGVQAQTCTPPPAPVITTQQPSCPHEIVTASIPEPPTGSWSSVQWSIEGGTFYPNGVTWAQGQTVQWSASSTAPVTLRVAGYDQNNCMTEVAVREVVLASLPPVIVVPESVCAGAPTTASVEPPSSGAWASISWTITNGYFVDPMNGSQTSTASGSPVTFHADQTGPVTLEVTTMDWYMCTPPPASAQVAVTNILPPRIWAEDDICPRSDHMASIGAPESGGSWGAVTWTILGGSFRDPSSGNLTPTATGPYVTYIADEASTSVELRVAATDANGCVTPQASHLVEIREIPPPLIWAEDDICPRSDHYASIGAPESGNWGPVTWTITGGVFRNSYTGETSTTASGPSVIYTADEAGETPVELTVEAIDSNGCAAPRASRVVEIRQIPPPLIWAEDDICPRSDHYASIGAPESGNWGPVTWTITGGTFRNSYTGETSTTASGPSVMYTADEAGETPVELTVDAIDSNGCAAPRASRVVEIRRIDPPMIWAEDDICPRSDHYASIGAPESGNWGPVTWTITGGTFRNSYTGETSTTASGPSVMYTADEAGDGPVELSVDAIDSNGCRAPRASRLVEIRQIDPPLIWAEDSVCPSTDHYASIGAPESGNWGPVTWTITGGTFRNSYSGEVTTTASGPSVIYFAEGSTPVELTVSAIDSNGCLAPAASRTVEIRQIDAPVISTSAVVCAGVETTASVGAPAAGTWSTVTWTITGGRFLDRYTGQDLGTTTTNSGSAIYVADAVGTVTLTARGIDMNGCPSPAASYTAMVQSAAPPVIQADNAVCANTDRTASVSGSWSTANWTITGGTFANGTTSATGTSVTYRADGSEETVTFTVNAINWDGCAASTATHSVIVEEMSAPTIETVAETCVFQPVTATLSGTTWSTGLWTIAGGRFQDGSTSANSTSVTFHADGTGDITLTVRGIDMSSGCTTAETSQTIVVNTPQPLVVTADLRACPNVPLTASVTGNASAVTWTIQDGHFLNALGEQSSTATGTEVTYVAHNRITVELTATSTDANGCPTSGSATVALGAGNTQVFVPDTSVCPGATGTANAGTPARGEWASVTWSITNGTGTPSGQNFNYTVGQSGITTITATATDPWGCTVTATTNITIEPATATITASGSTHLCHNGSVTLTAAENGSYTWSTGATTKSITVTTAGDYWVTVRNPNGCTTTSAPTTVTKEPTIPSGIGMSHVWGPLCEGMTNTLSAADIAGATYLWSTGETTRSITVSTTGNYSVTVTVPSGCTQTSSAHIVFQTAPKPTLELSQPAEYCGELTIEADYYGWGVERIWWEHTPGSSGYAIGTTYTAYGSGEAWFNVRYNTGCVRTSDRIKYRKKAGPEAWSYGGAFLCNGEPVTLEVFGLPDMSVTWSTGATTRSIVVTEPGSYSWSATGGAENCTVTGTIPVTVQNAEAPEVTASGPTSFCQGGSVTLTAEANASNWYRWSTGATTRAITVSQSGAYSVSVYDGSCLVTSTPMQVTVTAPPTATVSGTANLCATASTTISAALTGTGPWNLTWSDGFVQNGVTASPATRIVSPSATTTYSVTAVSDAHCAGTATGTAKITVNPKPVAGIRALQAFDETRTGTVTQNGDNVEACGNPIVRLLPQALDPSFTYAWSTGATGAALDVTTSGTYSVTVTTPAGCSTSSTVNVVVNAYPAKPVITAPQTQLCPAGGSVTLSAPNATGWLWSNGATTQSIVVSEPGSYSVRVRNGSCQSVISDPVDVTRGTSTITASGSTSLCENGSVTLTANDGTSWLWSNGATTRAITVTAPGSYSVITSNGSCAGDASQPVEVTQREVSISASGPTTFCNGESVTLTATEGASYAWSNGATSRSITVLASGTYDVVVSFADGCSMRTAPVVVESRQLVATVTADRTAVCAGGSIELTSNVSGGSSYSYQWYDNTYAPIAGATSPTLTHTPSTSGFVHLKVTDELGCPRTSNAVLYQVHPALDATIAAPAAVCEGATATASVANAGEGVTYSWTATNATVLFPASHEVMFTPTGSEPVTLTVTITNAGCSVTSSHTVAVQAPPSATITASGPTTFCQGGSVTLSAPAGLTYLWSTGATSREITVSAAGTYSVTVSDGTCSASSSSTVTVHPLPDATITASGPTTFCEGGQVTLSAPAGLSYSWSTGAISREITVSAAGTYSVTVSDGTCSATSSSTVTVHPLPDATITASGPTTFCEGGQVTLSAPAGLSYSWSTGAISREITVSAAGTYSVTVSDGTCSATSSSTVTVHPLPDATITASGPTTFCEGGQVTLSAPAGLAYSWSTGATSREITVSAAGTYSVTVSDSTCSATSSSTVTVHPLPDSTITASGPTTFCEGGQVTLSAPAGLSYSWSTGATSREITVSAAGTYSVTVSDGTCSATSSSTVTVHPLPDATITASGPTTFCEGGQVTLSAPVGATSYLWSNGATSREITVNTSGTYTVTATLGSCTATDSETVTVNAVPDAAIAASGPTTFCDGGQVTLSAPAGATSYLWSNGATSREITVNTSGTYTVTATLGSCTATDSETVTVNPAADATIAASGPTTFCDGGQVTLSAPAGATSYLWSNGATSREITVNTSGTYTVTATLGSCTATDSETITVNPAADATITASGPTTFCHGGQVTLSAPVGATSYLWSNGATSREITVNTSGTYTVTATLGSCTATDSETVTVNPAADATITASGPTTFCQGGQVTLSAPVGATS
ncbi:MAG TPA: hypothetical protein VEK11_15740, partial [Thermoanaerobaculia bacterium]|nr:hypothetical protein [Thermoanaerobaculia bacterium]